MSFYVKRTSRSNPAGFSFVGPIRSQAQAEKEVAAWESAGETVELLQSTPAVKATVRLWERVSGADDARERVWFQGEEMSMAEYRLFHEAA